MRIEVDAVFRAFDAALALVDDERQREALQRVIAASRDSVQRAVHDILRAAVDEVSEAGAGAIDVQLVYQAGGLELTASRLSPDAAVEEEIDFDFDIADIDRLTLRLPSELKEIAAGAAEQAGISLNTWLTRLVTREAMLRTRAARGEFRGRRGSRGWPDEPGRRRGPGDSLKGWIGG